MKPGDLIKKKCVWPEYGLIIDREDIRGASMMHRRLTVLWNDGTQSITWPQDIEVINECG